jgi:uncharacterized Zn finger protein
MREDARTKAIRMLGEGRILLEHVKGRSIVATVRGDSGAIYRVSHEAGGWSCDCEARSTCSHVRAVMLVTAPVRPVVS